MSRLLLLASLSALLAAQELKRPTLISPEILGQGRVVLRLWAPKATEVLLSGDWMGLQPAQELSKGGDGTWSITVGPLEPNIYTYAFLVDGVRAMFQQIYYHGRFSESLGRSEYVEGRASPRTVLFEGASAVESCCRLHSARLPADVFAPVRTVASFSGSIIERDFEDRFGKALAQPEKLRRDYRLIWIGCGDGDIFLPGNKAFSVKLTSANVPFTFREFPGSHAMPVFRRELAELLRKLFR